MVIRILDETIEYVPFHTTPAVNFELYKQIAVDNRVFTSRDIQAWFYALLTTRWIWLQGDVIEFQGHWYRGNLSMMIAQILTPGIMTSLKSHYSLFLDLVIMDSV
jgi:hypothetical protein